MPSPSSAHLLALGCVGAALTVFVACSPTSSEADGAAGAGGGAAGAASSGPGGDGGASGKGEGGSMAGGNSGEAGAGAAGSGGAGAAGASGAGSGAAGVGGAASCEAMAPASCPPVVPTYAELKPLFTDRCVVCHNGMPKGPWLLDDYADLADWQNELRHELLTCKMPPPDSGVVLDPAERTKLLTWLDCGLPH